MKGRPVLILLVAVAALVCYAGALRGMIHEWSTDEDMGQGFLVPAAVLWILWRERARWLALPVLPSAWGWLLLIAGAGLQAIGSLGGGLFAESFAFVVSIAGAVLVLGSAALLRAWAFPFALLLFMLPKLAIVYNQMTLPLQLTASRLAALLLTTAGAGVIREGNVLDVAGRRILVEEACDGIRFLLPLGFMALMLGYLTDSKPPDSKPWTRTALLISAAPMAVAANAVRVAAAGYWPSLTSGTAHLAAGWLIFLFCLAALALLCGLFHRVEKRRHA